MHCWQKTAMSGDKVVGNIKGLRVKLRQDYRNLDRLRIVVLSDSISFSLGTTLTHPLPMPGKCRVR